MTVADDIQQILVQEEALQFQSLTEADAWALGSLMRARAAEQGLPLVIDIRAGQKPLFYTALPGTTPENADWVRRKVNTVYRFEAASYRVGLQYTLRGHSFDQARGIEPLHHAPAGGGFPIRIGGLVVGAVTVSGVPQRQDHEFVVASLCAYLNKDHAALKLAPEAAA